MKCATAIFFCFLFYPVSLPAQSQKTLLLGLASISGGIETLYVTKKIGAFKRNGLDVDFLLLQGNLLSKCSEVAPGAFVRGDKTDQRRRWHGGAESALQGRGKLAGRNLHADHAVQSLCQRQDPRR